MEPISVDGVLAQSISIIQPRVNAENLKLIDHISGQGCRLQADFTRLKQVMLNLLSNAIKYNHKDGIITLDAKVINEQRLRISVTSTGISLTEAEIEKLFTPFERLDAKNNIEGTGIGLVICKHLIESMGGIIGVESDANNGNTFWLELAITKETVN